MSYGSPPSPNEGLKQIGVWFLGTMVVIFVLAVLIVGGVAGCGAYRGWQRGQARANAHNQVALTKIQIQNQEQYAQVIRAQNQVVKQQAYQRYLDSTGVRAAQDEISKTLTPEYLQYEAIKAEEAVATSGNNNTIVYVPSGAMGVPNATGNSPVLTLPVGKAK